MERNKPEPPLVLEPDGPVRGAMILLHGLGADGHDLAPLVPPLGLLEAGVRVLLPHAPIRPVTINGGHPMRAWYDIRLPDLYRDADCEGIRESTQQVRDLIRQQVDAGIPVQRQLLGGFSQGGVIALQAGLGGLPVAGIVALSTYLPCRDGLPGCAPDCPPVFQAHGTQDPIVPPAAGEETARWLAAHGVTVDFHRYPMGHAVIPDEIEDLRTWLQRRYLTRMETTF